LRSESISFHNYGILLAYLSVSHNCDFKVADRISEELGQHRLGLGLAFKACRKGERLSRKCNNRDIESAVEDWLYRPTFWLTYGLHDLACTFLVEDLDVITRLSWIEDVAMRHLVIGFLPRADDAGMQWLSRDPQKLLAAPGEKSPLMCACHLKLNSFAHALLGTRAMPAVMRRVSECIEIARNDIRDENKLKKAECEAVFVDSQGWSTWTVLFLTNNLDVAVRTVLLLRRTVLQDLEGPSPNGDIIAKMAKSVRRMRRVVHPTAARADKHTYRGGQPVGSRACGHGEKLV
jgi:hypothetical protein